jgi:glycosyltransferase involved in cell wall biosynthesis
VKILYLSQSGVLGGAERVLLDVAAVLRTIRPAWELGVIIPAAGDLEDAARALGIATTIVPFPTSLARLGDANVADSSAGWARWWRLTAGLGASSPALVSYLRRLRRKTAAIQPNLIHANGFKMHLLGARTVPDQAALLWHLHDYIGPRPLIAPLLRMSLRRCDAIVANSRRVAEDAQAALGGKISIRTVHNGVDLARFTPEGPRLDLDACAGLGPAAPGVLRVGMLATAARWKGHDVFLRALAMLPAGLPVRGYVIGGPIYVTDGSQFTMADLCAMASSLGLAGKVGFTGHLQDAAAALRSLDIVVHASIRPEPFGLVVAEAMATGRAVVTSGSGGVAELIEADRTALVHRPNDAPSLARAIERLALDRELRERLGRAGRLTAERRFDRQRMGVELAGIYDELIAARARREDAAAARS